MPDAVVVMPWRSLEPGRVKLQHWCQSRWESFGYRVIVSGDGEDDGPFCRSRAVNLGVEAADCEYVIVADADIAPHCEQVDGMVDAMGRGELYVVPYERFVQADESSSAHIRAAGPDCRLPSPFPDGCIRWQGTGSVCGLWAVRRADYQAIGGNDERFRGWGTEDVAFYDIARTFLGEPARLPYDLVHLYHPQRRDRKTDRWAVANADLGARYRAAVGDELAMTSLVREHLAERVSA